MPLAARQHSAYRFFAIILALSVALPLLEPVSESARGQVPPVPGQEPVVKESCPRHELVSLRTRDMKVLRNEDCTFTAMFGHYLHYEASPGTWEEVDLRLREEGQGHVMDRHDLVVRVPGPQVEITERATGKGIRWLTPVRPEVAGRKASFRHQGLDWTYATQKTGIKLAALVSAPLGPKTYEFTYQLLGDAAELAADEAGNLVSDAFVVPRAVAYGADGESYTATSWRLLPGPRAAFDFDDSALPAAAFPYELDPTTTFNVTSGGNDAHISRTGSNYPPGLTGGSSWMSTGTTTIDAIRSVRDLCPPPLGSPIPICPEYEVRNPLIRWDTSSLPDGTVISGATARLYVTAKADADGRSLTGDWWSGYPPGEDDYSDDAQTGAISGVALSSISTGGQSNFALDGAASNVSKTGFTGLRLHISGLLPIGANSVAVAATEHTSHPEPALLVTYNTAPLASGVSDAPDPVTAGDPIAFDVAWSDPDPGDRIRAVICKTNQISGTGTCPGGSWAAGASSATSPSSATYTPTAADHGAKTYYAFACDLATVCSSSISGTFSVGNRAPTVSSASDSPDPVLVPNPITFSVGWVDPADSVRAVICKTNELSAGTCPGGSWATGVFSGSSPASASFTPTPADVGTQTYFAFACDIGGACSTPATGTFTIYEPLPAGGVQLLPPETLHANGAELRWSPYIDPAVPFERYRVHRSSTESFTPSDATLLTEIRDRDVRSFTDTTAAPGQSFTYKLVVNSESTNGQTVTLPPAGKATKLLQPDPGRGTTARITSSAPSGCENYGGEAAAPVGSSAGTTDRLLLSFDIRDIPADANVESSTLQLHHGDVAAAMHVDLHAATSSWKEGTGAGACTGDGATWAETEGGVAWSGPGGDFGSSPAASVHEPAGEAPGWDGFDVTTLVQSWVAGDTPNLGMILKARDEGTATALAYVTDDEVASPGLRPKLAVTYEDGSASAGPAVQISSPAASDLLRGSVQLAAAATDDRRVDKVEFLVDGAVVGQDTSSPFNLTWSSATVSNGARSFTARATDDVGNVATSASVSATVDNSALPSVSLSTPSSGATVSGDVVVRAFASDDGGVARVEFLMDGLRIGQDATSPYEITWDTLDPDLPAYDGTHVLKAVVFDTVGQKTESAGANVTVDNTTGTKYRAAFSTSSVPGAVTYDPSAPVQPLHGIDVTVTNNSSVVWDPTAITLRYRWFTQEAPAIVSGLIHPEVTTSPPILLGPVLPDSSAQVTVLVEPPALPTGTARGTYRLQFDLYDQATGAWFAASGNQPSENPVVVNHSLMASALGVERYHHYRSQEVGAGMSHLMNVANGNSLLRLTPWSSRGRGLSTVLDLTYNSLEEHSDSLAGSNWSLSLSSLIRLGRPLDVHPNNADEIAGRANQWIDFVDGDGTSHRFEGKQASDGTVYWEEPAGVHLYLRQFSTTDPTRKWALTRPDRVTFFFDAEGYPTSVEDKNGNRLTFTLANVAPGEDPGGVSKRITRVTDAGGQFFTISYYSKAEARKPQIRGKVKTIADQSGSKLDFSYYEDGNLLRITQVGGTTPEGIAVPDRSFVFTYTDSSGSGPAISNPANRPDPDPKTSNQSTRLFSVLDPRGKETTFAYVTSGQDRWKLSSSTDRASAVTTYAYNISTRHTTVTNPSGEPIARTYEYDYDTSGKLTAVTNPRSDVTDIEWTADRHVSKVVEPNGEETRFAYNDNGYLTDRWDQLGNRTTLEYQNVTADGNDITGKWKTGRTIPHVSQLVKKTDPNGTATPVPGDYEWAFGYDTRGNLTQVEDPSGATTAYVVNLNGTLASVRDANNNITTFESYDANGCPTSIRDPLSGQTQLSCDTDGLVRWVQDPAHASYSGGDPRNYRTYFDFDAFHRLSRQSTPKSTQYLLGTLIWTGATYDANDNVTATVGPHYASQYTPSLGSRTETTYDTMDRPTLIKGPDSSGDPAGERTDLQYDKLGRLTRLTSPKGVKTTSSANDFATFFTYDALDRVATEAAHEVNGAGSIVASKRTHYCYDDPAGDLKWLVSPRANLQTVNCGQASPPSFTTKYAHDAAHRVTSVKDGLNQEEVFAYDANGNLTTHTNPSGDQQTRQYDERNALVRVTEPFSATRTVKTLFRYDGNGNLTQLISPRAFDASLDQQTFTQFVTRYEYDGLNRPVRVLLPISTGQPQQQYIHHEYDPNGRLLKTSLPTTQALAANAEWKTVMTYFDPGWVRSSNDPGPIPQVDFDYTAEGWQNSRRPQQGQAQDPVRAVLTTYFPDGMLKSMTDRAGNTSSFTYDANNNLLSAEQVATAPGSTTDLVADYDSFDQLAKVLQKRRGQTMWTGTTYAYDANANVTVREDDRTASSPTGSLSAGRRHTFSYDQADWLTEQIDDHGTPGSTGDDRRITTQFFPTGWEKQRVVARSNGSGGWNTKQTTEWTHFANGKLKTLTTRKGSGAIVEQHTVDYVDAGIYLNGNRTSDTFTLDGDNTQCKASPCTATYTYDARDRLTRSADGQSPATVTEYQLDTVGNVVTETVNGTVARRFEHAADRLLRELNAANQVQKRYWYDPYGNTDCVTDGSGAQSNCSPSDQAAASPSLLVDYAFDPLDRLTSFRRYDGGTKTDSATYVYDALDRVISETEDHPGSSNDRTTNFTHLGLTSLVTSEDRTSTPGFVDKSYAHDAYGNRITMTSTTGAGTEEFTYGYDVHGSVSTLLKQSDGSVKATYGYTPYGTTDEDLTKGDLPGPGALNPYRYSARRLDPGSDSYDMGARRFDAGAGRFLQQDLFMGALDDLGLSLDPLTQNRYSLAGGNPVSFAEWDGHVPIQDGGGAAVRSPRPSGGTSSTGLSTQAREQFYASPIVAPGVYVGGERRQGTATSRSGCDPERPIGSPLDPCAPPPDPDPTTFGDLLKGACDFLGPCAISDAIREGDWGALAFEVVTLIPFLKAGKLAKIAKHADDVGDASKRIAGAARVGRAGEAAAGILKNTQRINIPGGSYRVPDVLDDSMGLIGEVKNVQRLSYTAQLRDYVGYAETYGFDFHLWVRQGTQLSGPLRQAILDKGITVRYLP